MATFKELTRIENRFMFRGKIYKFCSYIPVPSIHMISDDGEKFSFGVNAPIADEFILLSQRRVERFGIGLASLLAKAEGERLERFCSAARISARSD